MESSEALQLFGITLVGATPENGRKLLLTLAIVVVVLLFSRLVRGLLAATGNRAGDRVRFWLRQATGLAAGVILVVGVVSIWFDDPTRLTTALGLITAGVAFALQRVITAVAGYFVILRGKTFNVGDRLCYAYIGLGLNRGVPWRFRLNAPYADYSPTLDAAFAPMIGSLNIYANP